MRHTQYRGLRCVDGYFYRSETDALVYFRSNDPNDTTQPDERITLDPKYDVFCWRPFSDIDEETYGTNYWAKPQHMRKLCEQLEYAIQKKRVERFFYPHGVSAGTQGHTRWRETHYAYYVAVDELWQRHTRTGQLDRDWLEVLAYSVLTKETSPEFRLTVLPGQAVALMRQILEAKTEEELERIRGLIGPYTPPRDSRSPMTYEEQMRLRIQRQIAANW